jgi:hypothetical protein
MTPIGQRLETCTDSPGEDRVGLSDHFGEMVMMPMTADRMNGGGESGSDWEEVPESSL